MDWPDSGDGVPVTLFLGYGSPSSVASQLYNTSYTNFVAVALTLTLDWKFQPGTEPTQRQYAARPLPLQGYLSGYLIGISKAKLRFDFDTFYTCIPI